MKKQSKYIPSILMLVIMGALFTACSSDQAAIDRAVQQTMEAQEVQQTNQESSNQNMPDVNSSAQDISIELTEPVSTPIDSNTNEQASPTPQETAVIAPTIADSDSERILFFASNFEEGIYNLFNVKPNGEDLHLVTSIDKSIYASVSPDLSNIAYLMRSDTADGSIALIAIYTVPVPDINNPNPEPILRSEDFLDMDDFVWSPDSSQIAIAGESRSGERGLFIIDIEANEMNFLVEDDIRGYPGLDIAWSADGQQLAFVSEENDVNTLLVLPKDGSFLMEVFRDPDSSYIRNLAWSEDGKNITFDQKIDDTEYTKIIDVISGEIVDVSNNVAPDNRGVWSPDGNRVAFVTGDEDEQPYDSNREIYIVNGDGSGLTQFTEYDPNTVWDLCPIWSPDGTQLAFISRSLTADGGTNELIVSDGSNRIVLMRDSENMSIDCPIAWTP